MDDRGLIRRYADEGAHEAFEELVRRHWGWVNGMARRITREAAMAEDVAQAVFVLLARKAKGLKREMRLANWLFTVTRYCAQNAVRAEVRRRRHEQGVAAMRDEAQVPAEVAAWEEIAPLLDEAVGALRRADREAVLQRFYQRKTFAEVGEALMISEEAARKRVTRSVEGLRERIGRRGVTVGAGALGAMLAANLTAGEASAATVAVMVAAAGGGAVPALAKGVGAAMGWTVAKPLAAVVCIGAAVAGLAGAAAMRTPPATAAATTAPTPDAPVSPTSAPATNQSDPTRFVLPDAAIGSAYPDTAGQGEYEMVTTRMQALGDQIGASDYEQMGETLDRVRLRHPNQVIAAYASRRLVLLEWQSNRANARDAGSRLLELASQQDPKQANFTRAIAAAVYNRAGEYALARDVFLQLDPTMTPQLGWFVFDMARYQGEHAQSQFLMPGEPNAGSRYKPDYDLRSELGAFVEGALLPAVRVAAANPDGMSGLERDQLAGAMDKVTRTIHEVLTLRLYPDLSQKATDQWLPQALDLWSQSVDCLDSAKGTLENPEWHREQIASYRDSIIPRIKQLQRHQQSIEEFGDAVSARNRTLKAEAVDAEATSRASVPAQPAVAAPPTAPGSRTYSVALLVATVAGVLGLVYVWFKHRQATNGRSGT